MALRHRSIRRRRGRGQALAEFALVFPIFLLLVMLIFDVGRAIFIYSGLTNAAREGARLAIVNQTPTMILERAQAHAFATVVTTLPADVVDFYREQPNRYDVDASIPDGTSADPIGGPANPRCDGIGGNPVLARGCIAVVEVATTWTAITPIIGNILGPIPFTARSQLPVEFVCPNPTYPEYDDLTGAECPKQP